MTTFYQIAGDPSRWDAEMNDLPDRGESLIALQKRQSREGRRSAHLVLSIYGWTLRYASGLQGFGIIHRTCSFDPAVAIKAAQRWVGSNPKRDVFLRASKLYESRCQEKGFDLEAALQEVF